jgi:hypothetical protein
VIRVLRGASPKARGAWSQGHAQYSRQLLESDLAI